MCVAIMPLMRVNFPVAINCASVPHSNWFTNACELRSVVSNSVVRNVIKALLIDNISRSCVSIRHLSSEPSSGNPKQSIRCLHAVCTKRREVSFSAYKQVSCNVGLIARSSTCRQMLIVLCRWKACNPYGVPGNVNRGWSSRVGQDFGTQNEKGDFAEYVRPFCGLHSDRICFCFCFPTHPRHCKKDVVRPRPH